ncbi:MAG: K(+)-transporting ATPase subunit C [Flavobacteriales bacterium]|jgi:K+-transporting ATPase ATPase C chain|nr:K(+)-transporting ATPase subunit C [Flavobacteriales bacterium]MBK6946250.1 K(+)-transporting ATPase subunit C [Flavobacteriales bacterium]MBK7238799.1 K(+)-transporting ATPase subunit C [Flavobacteriales bacterium]MBK9537076.1 K(+)-transporting ATPase subunit C [Flavobacteriales bacterium]MBP9137978.1 K(+)-transporting ATPase subunit C [Flavobacteriales bacterium]
MKQNLLPAVKLTLICLVFFSGVYTFALIGIAKLTPNGGNAETVEHDGHVYYTNLAQSFTQDNYFWSRPSTVGYNAAGSGASNKGATNPEYLATVQARIDTFIVHNPGVAKSDIPSELVTVSGSGLDPHVSVQGAQVQAQRVANARGMETGVVLKLIDEHTDAPLLGLFGPTTVNVLQLNLALDAASK